MLDVLQDPELVLEPADRERVQEPQRLDRGACVALAVHRLVDVPGGAAADAAHDPEPRRDERPRIHLPMVPRPGAR